MATRNGSKGAKRLALIECSPYFIIDYLKMNGLSRKEGFSSITQITGGAIPDESHVVRSFYDARHDVFVVVLTSETFAEVPDGDVIPTLPPTSFRDILHNDPCD